jgi:hypothetical protein
MNGVTAKLELAIFADVALAANTRITFSLFFELQCTYYSVISVICQNGVSA